MITMKSFRRMALGLEGAVEGTHMGHADFRTRGRIFATIQSAERGMVKLTPEQQAEWVAAAPDAFVPESGAWGRQGCTRVLFASAEEEAVGEAMTMAWRNAASAASSSPPRRPTSRRNAARRKG